MILTSDISISVRRLLVSSKNNQTFYYHKRICKQALEVYSFENYLTRNKKQLLEVNRV